MSEKEKFEGMVKQIEILRKKIEILESQLNEHELLKQILNKLSEISTTLYKINQNIRSKRK